MTHSLKQDVFPALTDMMRENHRHEPPAVLLLSDLIYSFQWIVCLPGPISKEQALHLQSLDDIKNSFEGMTSEPISDASVVRIWTNVLSNEEHLLALEHMSSAKPFSVSLLEKYDELHDTTYA